MGAFWDTVSSLETQDLDAEKADSESCKLVLKTFEQDDTTSANDLNNFEWSLMHVPDSDESSRLAPGVYSIQNKRSGTFVMLGPDEKRLGCWPKNSFKNGDTKLV
jgi:hypothetical protein